VRGLVCNLRQEDAVTHDPLCSHARQHRWFQRIDECQCDLIAKVRADQRDKDRQTVDALFPTELPNLSWVGYGQGILDATEALSAT
jgi:hypothetical protein